jgi:SNF2 family DNA or RNA helicase
MDSVTSTCYLCDNIFDVDELQKFQPGFVLDWRSNLKVPRLQSDILKVDPSSTPSSEEPVIRPSPDRRRTRKIGDGHTCAYDLFAPDGRCIHCLEEHNYCHLMTELSRCRICHRIAEECPRDESKSYFITRRLIELHNQYRTKTSRPFLKVIVFSQFRASLNLVGDRLLRKFGTACVAEYFGSHRKQELSKFTNDRDCFCLLLTKDGSEGLDLSFVTNVIFLEEIFDKAVGDQVVARAWRMGAVARVTIETLVAQHTIEEIIGAQTQPCDDREGKNSSAVRGDQQRLKSLLQSLRFITDHQSALKSTTTNSEQINDAIVATSNFSKRAFHDANITTSKSSKRECRTVRFAETMSVHE